MEVVALENPVIRSLSSEGYDTMDIDSVPDEESGSKKEDLSLRLTESDSDDEPLMPRVTKTFKRTKAVVDSDDEQLTISLPAEPNDKVSSDSEDDQLFGITSKSHRRILQNDSDDENDIVVSSKKKSYEELSSNNVNNATDSDDDELPFAKLKKKDVDASSGNKKRSKDPLPSWMNSDDSNTTVGTAENDDSNQTKNSSHKSSKMSEGPDWKSKLSSDLFSNDDSSSNEEGYSLEEIKSKAKKKWKMAEDSPLSEPKAEKSRKSKSKTTTPKVTKEETQKIHSESQRMVRESTVSLPYHKPKQRSLTEFLNRKRVPTNPGRSLKPSLKDLDAVAQVLEDRAKEVETFFKSDSEESGAEENQKSEPSPVVEEQHPFDTAEAPGELNSMEQLSTETSESITGLSATAGTSESSENLPQPPQTEENSADRVEKPRIVIEDPPEEIESTISPMKAVIEMELESSPDLSHSVAMDHKERLANLKRMSIANVPKPSLHGRPGQIIDLDDDGDDTGSKAGVNNLIERFVEQVSSLKKSPRKKDIQLNIVKKVVSAAGQVELKKDVITVSADEKHDPDSAISSGRRRQLVKDALRQSIEAKRAAERAKRQQEQRIDNEEDGAGDGESEKEEEILSDEPETDEDDMGDDEEEEEDEDSTFKKLKKKKKKKAKSLYLDEEAGVSEEGDLMDGSDEEDDEDTTNDVPVIEEPNLDRCDEDDSLDDASTVVERTTSMSSAKGPFGLSAISSSAVNNLSLSPNLDVRTNNPSHGLFSPSWQPGNSQDNMDELIGLCSGRFAPSEGKIEAGVSRSLFGHSQANDDIEEEEEEKGFMRILPAEDEEDEDETGPTFSLNDDTEAQVRAVAILSDDEAGEKDRSKRKKAKFFISDDEDDEDEPKSKTDRHRVDEEENEEEEEEMHEEEKEFRGITDFLDKEAELSGSELGSGDENEDGEDDWEEEDGDKEVFDDTQVRDQLGRVHLKTMLDQDQREVRLFQELFLEDGDLHSDGGGRQRQFRWKDAGADEDGQRPAGQKDDDAEDDSVEVEQDSAWRKMRQEREKWLQEQKAKQEAVVTDQSDPPLLKRNVRVVRVNSFSKAAANQSTAKAEPAAGTNQQQKILSPKKPLANTMVKRGSFLRRSDKDLSTIASLTKSVLPVQTARTGSNFVFASLTPERPATSTAGKTNENRKQKQMDSKDASNPPAKKAKTTGASKSIFSFFQ